MNPQWEDVAPHWLADQGALFDLYIFDTDEAAWQSVLDAIRTREWSSSYTEDAVPSTMPDMASDIFRRATDAAINWTVSPGSGVTINCHFFTVEEIEFDIDPRQVAGQSDLDAIFAFIRLLGRTMGKDVVMTPESLPDRALIRYNPATDGFLTDFG